MVARRREKRRFQLDVPRHQQPGVAPSTLRGLGTTHVMVAQRRRRHRFHVALAPDTPRWKIRLLDALAIRRRVRRRVTLTLAQRRQLRRLGMIAGGLCVLVAIVFAALWEIPSTHAALFPQAPESAAEAAQNAQAGSSINGRALHVGSLVPFSSLQTYAASSAAPAIQASAAFVFDPQRGVILYQKNPDATYPAAGLAKVMTLLIAVQSAPLDQMVTIGPDAAALVNSDNSYMGVSAGEQITLGDLLYGMMVAGGNDAAVAIPDAIAGSEPAFVALMNQRAFQLGLTHTHFVSPDGAASGDTTSASDIAKLSALALLQPGVEPITSASQYSIAQTSTHKTFNLQSSNELLAGGSAPYAGADGVRTGYTADAGYCIAFSARSNGRLIVGALLGDPSEPDRAGDAHALLDWAFAQQ